MLKSKDDTLTAAISRPAIVSLAVMTVGALALAAGIVAAP